MIFYGDVLYVNFGNHRTHLKPLEILNNKLMRWISGCLSTLSIELLHLYSGLDLLCDELQSHSAKYWNRMLHIAPNNLLYAQINDIWYGRWKKLIMSRPITINSNDNDNVLYSSPISQTHQPSITLPTYHKKSVFFTSYKNAESYGILTTSNFTNYQEYDHHYRLFDHPYDPIEIPSCFSFLDDPYTQRHPINLHENILYIFTDGSLKDNVGGGGVYIEYHLLSNIDGDSQYEYRSVPLPEYGYHSNYNGSCYDINWIELITIALSLDIVDHIPVDILNQYDRIHIITDNEVSFGWITGGNKIHLPYAYNKVIQIHQMFQLLHDKLNIIFSIQWCNGHIWVGNNAADILAKSAIDNNINEWILEINPISFTQIKTLINNSLSQITKSFISKTIQNHIISYNISRWNVVDYDIMRDMMILGHSHYSVITQLRSQHVRLNEYYHLLNHRIQYQLSNIIITSTMKYIRCVAECCGRCDFGQCIPCGANESVHHFILFCRLYNRQRTKYLHTVQALLINKYHIAASLRHLLFPPPNVTIQHRKAILQYPHGD